MLNNDASKKQDDIKDDFLQALDDIIIPNDIIDSSIIKYSLPRQMGWELMADIYIKHILLV